MIPICNQMKHFVTSLCAFLDNFRASRHAARILKLAKLGRRSQAAPGPQCLLSAIGHRSSVISFGLWAALCLCGEFAPAAETVSFERVVIDASFPGGYQVEVADVNGDGRPDVIGVGGGTCAWFENPTWKKRVVTTPRQSPGIISSATRDIDGDGKAEIAIAYEFDMNKPTKGKLLVATQGAKPDDSWSITRIADVGSIHRLRWGGKPAVLIVAPIFGVSATPPSFQESGARIELFSPGGTANGSWTRHLIAERPVLHSVEVRDVGTEFPEILTADNLGVARIEAKSPGPEWSVTPLVPGAPGEAPKRGSSEVHLGKLADGRRFIATIDPWHGNTVSICRARSASGPDAWSFEPRTVIDDTLRDGHALWVADVDGDGDDEVFAGHRGADHRISVYDFDGKSWNRTVLDRDIAAQDLRGGDLDGDGTPDVVAIGGSTHNVVWYRPRKK